ncbi:MAG: helix-turn-helix transcriptional regulator [Solirubrobacterales bacterium]|nr:helix-turn-helix transcriptional regulator [Solirubrobacterales bacterium]
MRPGEPLKGHLDVLLLAVLGDGPRHGYAIVEQLRARSEGHFELPEGTVYPALHRLERDGLLCSEWSVVGGRRRRQYELTQRGQIALGRRANEWHRFATAVEAVLGRGEPRSAVGSEGAA